MISTDIFILTADWRDSGNHHELIFYGRSPKLGPVEIIINNVPPVFFIERNVELPRGVWAKRKTVELKTPLEEPVDVLYFTNQRNLKSTKLTLEAEGIQTYEADVLPTRRYLMERFINSAMTVTGNPEEIKGQLRFVNPTVKPVVIEPRFSIMSLDIETGVHEGIIYSIAFEMSGVGLGKKKVIMIGSAGTEKSEYLTFVENEKELLKSFLEAFAEVDPDIIIGWHVVGFDLLFIEKRCHYHGLKFSLGRHQQTAQLRERRQGQYIPIIPGRVVLDGPVALRSNFFSFSDYSLEGVAQVVLGEGKLINSNSEDKIKEIDRQFREDKEALAAYNLQDCELVTQIFSETKLIELCAKRAEISGMLLENMGQSVAALDHFFLPQYHRAGYVALNADDIEVGEHAAGGYVIDPVVGIHKQVVAIDFQSLYPSIIRTFFIDPLSRQIANLDDAKDVVTTPNNYRFSSKINILPEFIRSLLERRRQAKKNNDAQLSQAIKILMNSLYGVMGSFGCRFYHPDLPRAITGTGQWILQETSSLLKSRGYEVIYGDTDSLFVKHTQLSLTAEDSEEIVKMINQYWQARLKEEFSVDSHLMMEFEKLYKVFVLPAARNGEGGAKKRYAGLVADGDLEKLDFVGMEFVRSDWTELAKEFQQELFRRTFKEEEVDGWIKSYVKDLYDGNYDKKLVYNKRIRRPLSEYTKSTPPHVKAARLLKKAPRKIQYVITKRGPIPLELEHEDIDYRHYVEKQLKPLADTVLTLFGRSFTEIIEGEQLRLFE